MRSGNEASAKPKGIDMSDLNSDLRLVIDTGRVVFGSREVMRTISDSTAKAVVVATLGKKDTVGDILHVCEVSGIKVIRFEGNSVDLGALCGRPFAVNALTVLEPGNSGILNEEYS